MIPRRLVIEQHALANNSDPFAGMRLNTHIRRQIVTEEDYQPLLLAAGRAIGGRYTQAKRLPKGEFVSMRTVGASSRRVK